MDLRLTGKTALVTGATAGIGLEIARTLATLKLPEAMLQEYSAFRKTISKSILQELAFIDDAVLVEDACIDHWAAVHPHQEQGQGLGDQERRRVDACVDPVRIWEPRFAHQGPPAPSARLAPRCRETGTN